MVAREVEVGVERERERERKGERRAERLERGERETENVGSKERRTDGNNIALFSPINSGTAIHIIVYRVTRLRQCLCEYMPR